MRVRGTNFLSWADLEFWVKPGVTLIRGHNFDDGTDEGSGKSAILNLIAWTYFGELPKEANIDDVVKEGCKGCEGEVDLPGQFSVFRSRSPNDLHIKYPNGKIFRGKDAHETQKEIIKLLGMSFKTFCQVVYFAQNYPHKFVTANQELKGKILSEILDLEQFDRARKVAAERIKVVEGDLRRAEVELNTATIQVQYSEGDIKSFEQLIKEFEEAKVAKISRLFKDHHSVEVDMQSFDAEFRAKKHEDLLKESEELKRLEAESRSLDKNKKRVQKELKELQVQHGNFSTVLKNLETELERAVDQKAEAKAHLSQIDSELKAYGRKEQDLKVMSHSLTSKTFAITRLEAAIVEARKEKIEAEAHLAKLVENPDKGDCPTCGQSWDGTSEHHEKEVTKAGNASNKARANLKTLKLELEEAQSEKVRLAKIVEQLKQDVETFTPTSSQELEDEMSREDQKIVQLKGEQRIVREEMAKAEKLESELKILQKHDDQVLRSIERVVDRIAEVEARDLQQATQRFWKRLAEIEAEIEAEDSKEPTTLQEKLKKARGELAVAQAGKNQANDKVQVQKTLQNRLEALREGYKETKAYTFERTLAQLTSKANGYLKQLFNQPVQIRFKNEDLKIDTMVKIEGRERPLGLYSGGQFRRIALAVDLALADVTLSRKGNRFNLLVLDEYFKDLSVASMGRVLKILQNRKTPTLLIEHNDLFKSIVSNSVEIELRNGTSSIKI